MRRKKGFTLLELIIVIIVIGILASVALPRYLRVAEKGRYAEATNLLSAYRSAQLRYELVKGNFTNDCTDLDVDVTSLKYFGPNATCYQAASVDDTLVMLKRNSNDAPTGYAGYEVSITANGGLNCTASTGKCP